MQRTPNLLKTSLLPSWTPLLMGACLCVMLVAGLSVRFSAVAIWDDAWFYTRYAGNFLEQGSYQWNPGERGYGLTAPLYGQAVLFIQASGLNPALVLWGMSLSCGLAMIGMVLYWVHRYADPSGKNKRPLLSFALAAIALNIPTISSHLASGMETTASMLYFMLYLILFHHFAHQLSPGRTLVLGFLGGLAWGIRPELALLTWGIPSGLVFFAKRPMHRQGGAYILLFTAAVTLVQMYIGLRVFGTVFPLSFWAKTTNPYGPEMAAAFSWQGIKQLVLFLSVNVPSLAMIAFAVLKGKKAWWRFLALHERILLVGLVVFWIYHGLLVLPIMSYSARFFYPFWPGLLWLGLRSLQFLMTNRDGGAVDPQRKNVLGATLAIFMVLITAVGSMATIRTRHSGAVALMGKFDVRAAYDGVGQLNWVGLDTFASFPPDFSIASTELGILGMMRMGAPVCDMSGLHDARMLKPQLGVDHLLGIHSPDLIYMPSAAYRSLDLALRAHPLFASKYKLLEVENSYNAVALRLDSPYFAQMKQVLQG